MLLGSKRLCPSPGRQDASTVRDRRDTGLTATTGGVARGPCGEHMSRKGSGERPKCSCFKDSLPQLPGNEAHVHSSRMLRTGLIQDRQL